MSKPDQSNEQDVVVVGGGPSGRIAAIGLAQLGLSVALVAPVAGGQDGRTTALIGASGCVKSTALRCFAGLQWPDEGTVTVAGAHDAKAVTDAIEGAGFTVT